MGAVVQLAKRLPQQVRERTAPSIPHREYLSALAESLHAIEIDRSSIEKDLQLFQTILLSTADPELRARVLEQLKSMQDPLSRVALELVSAKELMKQDLIPSQNQVG
jgi:hypothetical protein